MGYFCLPETDDVKGELGAAIANIELYLRTKNPDYEYLLEQFAIGSIKQAIKLLNEQSNPDT